MFLFPEHQERYDQFLETGWDAPKRQGKAGIILYFCWLQVLGR